MLKALLAIAVSTTVVALSFAVPTAAPAVPQGFVALGSADAERALGASGFCQTCSLFNNGTCPGPAACGADTCYEYECTSNLGAPMLCCAGFAWGCTSQVGGYQECLWARSFWCDQSGGVGRCGTQEWDECQQDPISGCDGCLLRGTADVCLTDC